jgi:outer membrane protein OmpA-like peptidoglycan-associated protein
MRKLYVVGLVSAIALGATTACASKKFVRSSVGATNDKVESMIDALEETQARTARNEKRIAEVDGKVDGVAQSASMANGVATKAASAARAAGAQLEAIDKAQKKLVYDVVLSANEANFAFGKADLPSDARAKIDALIGDLTQDPKNVFIEIEGHTDAVGSNAANAKVGLQRAQAVQRYLYDHYQIPLHKMNVISFGEERPAASNSTPAGRAQNRRIVIRIRA